MKASRTFRKIKDTRRRQIVIGAAIMFLFVGSLMIINGSNVSMSAFEATNDRWSGRISIGGFIHNGRTFNSEASLPSEATDISWGTDSLTVDLDGDTRFHGSAIPFGVESNTDLPWPEHYPGLEGYPTALPQITWTIMDNIRHIDVNDNTLETGVPSVSSSENGYLNEVYYYMFSVKLELTAEMCDIYNFYFFDIGGYPFGAHYMYDLAPLRGLYLLPEIKLTSNNDSIIDMGSDLATLGPTDWKFHSTVSPFDVVNSSIVQEEFRTEGQGTNRDFFLAGGDSGAGLNIYNKVDENTNRFSLGFVKVGIPAYFTGTVEDAMIWHTVQTTAYNIELVIPLRMSVIVTYDIPYTGDTVYTGGFDDGEQDMFSDLRDLEQKAEEFVVETSGGVIPMEYAGIALVVVALVVLVVFGRRQ